MRLLTGADHIIHGSDIGRPDVIAELRGIAPVTVIRGNVDKGDWADDYADTELVRLAARSIFVVHDLKMLGREVAPARRNPHVPPRLNVLEAALEELEAKHAPGN